MTNDHDRELDDATAKLDEALKMASEAKARIEAAATHLLNEQGPKLIEEQHADICDAADTVKALIARFGVLDQKALAAVRELGATVGVRKLCGKITYSMDKLYGRVVAAGEDERAKRKNKQADLFGTTTEKKPRKSSPAAETVSADGDGGALQVPAGPVESVIVGSSVSSLPGALQHDADPSRLARLVSDAATIGRNHKANGLPSGWVALRDLPGALGVVGLTSPGLDACLDAYDKAFTFEDVPAGEGELLDKPVPVALLDAARKLGEEDSKGIPGARDGVKVDPLSKEVMLKTLVADGIDCAGVCPEWQEALYARYLAAYEGATIEDIGGTCPADILDAAHGLGLEHREVGLSKCESERGLHGLLMARPDAARHAVEGTIPARWVDEALEVYQDAYEGVPVDMDAAAGETLAQAKAAVDAKKPKGKRGRKAAGK